MTKYTEFYFLHIPKSGGRSFKDNVILPIRNLLVKNNISLLRDSDIEYRGHGHSEWADDIADSSYVVCTFRDPVKHLVSLFSHTMAVDKRGNQLVNKQPLEKKDFFLWIDANRPMITNFQSKNIASATSAAQRVEVINRNLVFERIRRTNMFLKLEDIDPSSDGIGAIREAILKELGIDSSGLTQTSVLINSFSNPFSQNLYNLLTTSEIDDLSHISPLDSEIHKTSSLFWRK